MVFIVAEEQLKAMQGYVQVKFDQILMVFFDVLAWSLLFVDRFEGLLGLKDAIGDTLEVFQKSFKDVAEKWIEKGL